MLQSLLESSAATHGHPLSFSRLPEDSSTSGFSVNVVRCHSKGCHSEGRTEAKVSLEFPSGVPSVLLCQITKALCTGVLQRIPSVLKKRLIRACPLRRQSRCSESETVSAFRSSRTLHSTAQPNLHTSLTPVHTESSFPSVLTGLPVATMKSSDRSHLGKERP